MNASEILWRMRGVVSANIDLVRIPLRMYPKVDVTGTLSVSRFTGGFECSPVATESSMDWGSEPLRSWRDRLVHKADAILANRLSFFDLVDQDVDDPVNWHTDFSSGKTAALKLSGLIDYRNFDDVGDCKLVWEPNRHHQLVVLARAYVATSDKRYAIKIADLMSEWLDSNPFGYGMNWKSPLEVGIRLINWVWAIELSKEANVFSAELWSRVLESIYLAMWDLQRKFSQGSSANNHLIGEAAGVFIATSYFSEFADIGKWREESQKILEEQIQLQSYSDGCTREHAFGYQFFVIQFLTQSLLAGNQTGRPFSPQFQSRLHQMYRFMAELCADTGGPPNFGDADDGYVLDLGDLPEQAKQLLAVGAQLFDDESLVIGEESETAFWLFGKQTVGAPTAHEKTESMPFKESGYYILRAGNAGKQGCDNVSVFFDCADLGYGSIAAHGHADCLSFTLAVGDQEIFVDSGTYDYFTHPEWREYFRSTRAHNTLAVDGQCQSESLGPFIWGQRAEAKLLDWQDDNQRTTVSGEHSGYLRLPDPTVHRRTLTLHKDSGRLEIRDRLVAKQQHNVRIYFHTAPGTELDERPNGDVVVKRGSIELLVESDGGRLRVFYADETGPIDWISDGYHRKKKSGCIVLELEVGGDTDILTQIRFKAT